jgi:hypothetical protein
MRRRHFTPSVEGMEARELLSGLGVHAAASSITTDPAPPANRHEVARRAFSGRFSGPVVAIPPRTTDNARGFGLVGQGSTNQFLHGFMQMVYFTPASPSGELSGAATLSDRNVNNAAIVGLDFAGSSQDVDRFGRPTHLTWTVSGASNGPYSLAEGSGTVVIRYQGRNALAIFNGSINTSGVTNPVKIQ